MNTFLLHETASGYALFKKKEAGAIAQDDPAVQVRIGASTHSTRGTASSASTRVETTTSLQRPLQFSSLRQAASH